MKKIVFILYALVCYTLFFATFLYMIGFVENVPALFVAAPLHNLFPKTLDTGYSVLSGFPAILTDLCLMALFGLQHSVMARQGFKKKWTRLVPRPVERSTYVLFASLALMILFRFWQTVNMPLWNLNGTITGKMLFAISMLGWGTLLVTTFLINHFDLLGLRQVYFYARNKELTHIAFRQPLFYRYVRHPLYFSFLLAFWFAPVMTVGHLVFSSGMTIYIFIGIYHEEKDLVRYYGERYKAYRMKVPKIIPFTMSLGRKRLQMQSLKQESLKPFVMKNSEQIHATFDRIVQAMNRQPGIGKGNIHTMATYREGLACDLECGRWKMKADMNKVSGGGETAPTPGEYMSMALAGCQAITTALWAAHYGVKIDKLDVSVDIDKDARGLYGVDQQPAHWRQVSYHVDIQSPASESDIQKVLDAAFEHSPMRDNLEYGFSVKRDASYSPAPAL